MKTITTLVATTLVTALCASACDDSPNGCEDARHDIQAQIDAVCGEPAYVGSPFCSCCVKSKFYSVDNDCLCRDLRFDAPGCFYSKDDQARPQVRAAIDFANSICSVRKPALPWPSDPDVGDACRIASETEPDAGAAGAGSTP